MFQKKKTQPTGFVVGLAVGIFVALIIGVIFFVTFNHQKSNEVQSEQSGQPDIANSEPQNFYTFDISSNDHIYGDFESPVTLVVFSDLECSFSADFNSSCLQLFSDPVYQGKVRIVWRHFPLDSTHPHARTAAVASECAAKQGNFWEFVQSCLDDQDKLGSDLYQQIAENLELDMAQFQTCLQEPLMQDIVEAHYQEGWAKGVRGTPISFLNGQMVKGALSYPELKAVVDQELK